MERTMDYRGFDQINMKQNGMDICLLFPKKPEREENIKKEVKSILSCALREHLKRNN